MLSALPSPGARFDDGAPPERGAAASLLSDPGSPPFASALESLSSLFLVAAEDWLTGARRELGGGGASELSTISSSAKVEASDSLPLVAFAA